MSALDKRPNSDVEFVDTFTFTLRDGGDVRSEETWLVWILSPVALLKRCSVVLSFIFCASSHTQVSNRLDAGKAQAVADQALKLNPLQPVKLLPWGGVAARVQVNRLRPAQALQGYVHVS